MLLKEVYNQKFVKDLATTVFVIDRNFHYDKFLSVLAESKLQNLSLKQRMRAISLALQNCLSHLSYQEQISLLKKVVVALPQSKYSSLSFIIFPDFVEVFGVKYFDDSMQSLEFFTEFGTSEFAVRKFINNDSKKALIFFEKWSKNKNHHIRRLASEGLRPRLPWGEALPEFKCDPSLILPILENLKNDESEYVRRSVANNLNDISKDNPKILLNLAKKWHNKVDEKLLKHALRTLLKKGDKDALELIGIKSDLSLVKNFLIKDFNLKKMKVKIGEVLDFDFALENEIPNQKIRLEYAIFFLKKNGSHSKKVFQITTKNFTKGLTKFNKKQSFCDMTTRKHYSGLHFISLVVNGVEMEKKEFYLA